MIARLRGRVYRAVVRWAARAQLPDPRDDHQLVPPCTLAEWAPIDFARVADGDFGEVEEVVAALRDRLAPRVQAVLDRHPAATASYGVKYSTGPAYDPHTVLLVEAYVEPNVGTPT